MGIETLAMASMFASMGGSMIQAGGQAQAGRAAEQSAMYSAQVAENNATIARQQAARELEAGQVRAQEQGRRTGGLRGSQLAAMAAAGVDVNSGTAVDNIVSSEMMGRIDALRIYDDAIAKSHGSEVQAVNFQNEAELTRRRGRNAREAANTQALGTLVSSAGSFSSRWAGFSRNGALGAD